jgi:hypothetical protein
MAKHKLKTHGECQPYHSDRNSFASSSHFPSAAEEPHITTEQQDSGESRNLMGCQFAHESAVDAHTQDSVESSYERQRQPIQNGPQNQCFFLRKNTYPIDPSLSMMRLWSCLSYSDFNFCPQWGQSFQLSSTGSPHFGQPPAWSFVAQWGQKANPVSTGF